MPIHHSLIKKAAKFGLILNEQDGKVRAFWPEHGIEVFAATPAEAIAAGEAAQREARENSFKGIEPATSEPEPDTIERINGIAINGAVAYKEGTSAADCPYSSEEQIQVQMDDGNEVDEDNPEYENFVRWNEEWDAAADAHEEENPKEGGSVVATKYRLKYAEMGHPTHCGDWLAETLNEIVLNKEGVNLELFEAICNMNDVDTSKYKRSGVGWQGRIRMTGRNLLAKKVYLAGGVLLLPETINGGKAHAPGDWMQEQRFKVPKADQGAPTIAIASGAK